jgi:hypothetical protein
MRGLKSRRRRCGGDARWRGFGTKLFPYREYALAGFAAQRLGRPVKWVADRSEHFLGDAQGRDNVTTAKLALDGAGRFLALDIDLIADMGAYLSCYAPFIPFIGAGMSPGVYDIPVCRVRVRGAFTNSVPVDAYRGPGAGRPCDQRSADASPRVGVSPDALPGEFHQSDVSTRRRPAKPIRRDGRHLRAQARRLNGFEAAARAERRAARHRHATYMRPAEITGRIRACRPTLAVSRCWRISRPGRAPTAYAQLVSTGFAPERAWSGRHRLIATGTDRRPARSERRRRWRARQTRRWLRLERPALGRPATWAAARVVAGTDADLLLISPGAEARRQALRRMPSPQAATIRAPICGWRSTRRPAW